MNFTTIGGLVLNESRSVPSTGQKFHWLNFEIEVVDMDGARIDKLIIREIDPED